MSTLDVEVTRQANDVVIKAVTEMFKDKTLKVFGLNTARIVRTADTELPVLKVKETRKNFVFLLKDDTFLHLEFQTTTRKKDMKDFLLYDARLVHRDGRDVQTAVIYSGEIREVPEILQ